MGGVAPDRGVKAPDGGWGWAVLFGCFVITGFSYAFPKAVSVFFKELILEFHVGYSDTAWISSIVLAMLYGTGRGRSRVRVILCFIHIRCAVCSAWCSATISLLLSLSSAITYSTGRGRSRVRVILCFIHIRC